MNTASILVADDLPENLLVYRSVLDDLGPTLVTVRSGEEALREVLKREFAVILLDVNMPGMSGLETATLIRQRRRSAHTPIIFLTAYADEVTASEGYAHGAVDYISTPVIPEILRAKVRVFVDLYRMSQQVRRQAEERIALAEERVKRASAEETTRRSNFLAEISRALADSLDPVTTAQALVRQVVPFLADLAGVSLVGPHGLAWSTEFAWVFPSSTDVHTCRLGAAEAPKDELRAAVDRALVLGQPDYQQHLDVPYPKMIAESDPAAGRIRSAIVLPLQARGRTLGALSLMYGPSDRRYSPTDLALAEELASRAAIALDNARLYKEVETADRHKNEFLSMLAHELRNPLAPIRNAAEVLRLKGLDQPQIRWAWEVIDRQTTHLVRLVDDLLDVSRITKGKIRLVMHPADLGEILTHAVEASRPLIERFQHRLEVAIPSNPIRLNGDSARLVQVFTNLLNNAAKYTEPGGEVCLKVAVESVEAVVRIRDTGIGIPPEMLAAVFELFVQADRSIERSQGGLGVGLTLAKRLVEMHGGRMEAYSDGAGKGSEFVVRLPIEGGERTAGTAHPESAAAHPPSASPIQVGVAEEDLDPEEDGRSDCFPLSHRG